MAREGHIPVGYTIWPSGAVPLAWRLPGAWANPFTHRTLKETARLTERGLLDFYFVGDQYAADAGAQYRSVNHVTRPEAYTTAAYIAGLTEHIGIVATGNTTYQDPYSAARQTAQLDWVSNGRALWNIVTGLNTRPAANYGRERHWDNQRRYDWAEEFTEVVTQLWDSWDDDAVPEDKASGLLVDPDKVRAIDHQGEFFSVRGPLNIGRPPQGQVPILHAGSSERSREFGARFADARFFNVPTPEYYADVKGRLAKYGRTPDQQVLLAGVTILVGQTEAEAKAKWQEIVDLTHVSFDARVVALDLNLGVHTIALDVPISRLQEIDGEALLKAQPKDLASHSSLRGGGEDGADVQSLVTKARTDLGVDDPTIRQVYANWVRGGQRDRLVVGDATQVADWIEEKYETYCLDGINTFTPYLPGALDDFVDLVVPELQRRGRFRTEYRANETIRERWGLHRPESQYDGAELVRPRGAVLESV